MWRIGGDADNGGDGASFRKCCAQYFRGTGEIYWHLSSDFLMEMREDLWIGVNGDTSNANFGGYTRVQYSVRCSQSPGYVVHYKVSIMSVYMGFFLLPPRHFFEIPSPSPPFFFVISCDAKVCFCYVTLCISFIFIFLLPVLFSVGLVN